MKLRTALIRRITVIVFLAASCNLVWQFYRLHEEAVERQRLYEETGWTVCTFGSPRDAVARFHLEFFLMLALIGTRVKGLKSTLLSVVGLSGAVIIYVFWWQYIFRVARNAEMRVEAINNFAYLVGGTLLDITIAASIVLLVVLNVSRAALSSFRLNIDEP